MENASSFRTILNIASDRSQGLVLLLGVGGIFVLLVSFAFMWVGKTLWWIPLVVALCLVAASLCCWVRSHRDIDRRDGLATTISHTGDGGFSISLDPRTMKAEQIRELFGQVLVALPLKQGQVKPANSQPPPALPP
jgi:hypothetical protein